MHNNYCSSGILHMCSRAPQLYTAPPLPGWTSSRVLSKGCQNEIKNWKIAMIWGFMIRQKLSNHTEHEISKELHMNAQTSYLSALDFCNSPVWNIEFDELDFFPSSNWHFLPACKIQIWNRLKIKLVKLDISNWRIAKNQVQIDRGSVLEKSLFIQK